ncbi:MAG: 4'-phosphopantetheinyl transferase superfamily protein [Anaerolineales bacterium]
MAFQVTSPVIWKLPPPAWTLPDQEIHLWQASLDQSPATVSRLSELLSKDERARAGRFYFERDRRRFITGRGILRAILGRYLDLPPEKIHFQYGDHGKPALSAPAPLRFNLAHSNALILLAFTLRHEIGLDVEYLRPIPEADGIAGRFFTQAESQALRSLPESQKLEGFFTHWVCKEAYLKALGDGLARPLDQFEILPTPKEPQGLLKVMDNLQETERWSFQLFRPSEGYVAALAAEKKDLKSLYWQWADP